MCGTPSVMVPLVEVAVYLKQVLCCNVQWYGTLSAVKRALEPLPLLLPHCHPAAGVNREVCSCYAAWRCVAKKTMVTCTAGSETSAGSPLTTATSRH